MLTINADVAVGDTVKNSAAITKENGEDQTDPPTDETETTVVPNEPDTDDRGAQLVIKKQSSVANGSKISSDGGVLTYEILVTNEGNEPAASIVVRDPIPTHTSYVSSGCSAQAVTSVVDSVLVCEIGVIAPGETVTVTLVVNVSAWKKIGSCQIQNTAVLDYDTVTLTSNTVTHTQKNTSGSGTDVPKTGEANDNLTLMLLALAGLLGSAAYLTASRRKAKR